MAGKKRHTVSKESVLPGLYSGGAHTLTALRLCILDSPLVFPRRRATSGVTACISNILPREVDVGYLDTGLYLLSLPFWADLLGLPFNTSLIPILGANGMFRTRTSP